MCYAKPGNRCSSHAKAAYADATKTLEYERRNGSPADVRQAEYKAEKARLDFHTTPEGQKALDERIRHYEASDAPMYAEMARQEKKFASDLRTRRSEASKEVTAMTDHVSKVASAKYTRDFEGGKSQAESAEDKATRRAVWGKVQSQREVYAREVKLLREELEYKVDAGTVGRRDYTRLSKAMLRSERFESFIQGSHSVTGDYGQGHPPTWYSIAS